MKYKNVKDIIVLEIDKEVEDESVPKETIDREGEITKTDNEGRHGDILGEAWGHHL